MREFIKPERLAKRIKAVMGQLGVKAVMNENFRNVHSVDKMLV